MYGQTDYSVRHTRFLLTCPILQIANITSVAISLPVIGRDFNIPEQRLQWLVSAFGTVFILCDDAIHEGHFSAVWSPCGSTMDGRKLLQ